MKKIHVNQHKIRKNIKALPEDREPCITIKDGKNNTYCYEVDILGSSKLVYRPDKPLSCGAKIWLETEANLIIDGVPYEK